ncbi:MAG TPA: nucleotidyltransferase family protein [Anaeromyxobacteraceae bacterium]|nr:nucleotidyltransferase family protein [Anaeromyxobacteraceae bacterium]
MPLLDALRALTAFRPPPALPACDLRLLGDVLVAHGLAPMASYHVENGRIGAGLPDAFRERLLSQYQGVVNDNVLKLVTLRNALKAAADVPVVLLEAAAYVDWLYPHMAWRPVADLRVAVRGEDGARFAAAIAGGFQVAGTGAGGRTATFTDGKVELRLQEGLWPGAPEDAALFTRRRPAPAFGPSAARPAPEEALLATVADLAQGGLFAPLIAFVDLRELAGLVEDAAGLRRRAAALGLSRALHGATLLLAHFFPETADAARALRPELGLAERVAVERLVGAAKDPARLSHLRGAEAAARLLVAP